MTIRKPFEWPLGASYSMWAAIATLAGCFAFITTSAAANSATFQGVLIDKQCSPNAETRIVSDPSPHLEGGMLWADTHKRSCLLMPACERSGYGIVVYDSLKYLTFDPAGNAKALALIRESKKEDDFRVEVTGEVQGDTIKVATLKLLP